MLLKVEKKRGVPEHNPLDTVPLAVVERHSSPTPTSSVWDYRSVPTPAQPSVSVSRQSIQNPFESAGFNFTRQGSDDWYVGTSGDVSGVSVEIFGSSRKVEAVELWLMVNQSNDIGARRFLQGVVRLTRIMCGGRYQEIVAIG